MEVLICFAVLYFGFKLIIFLDKSRTKLKKTIKYNSKYLIQNDIAESVKPQKTETYEFKTLLSCEAESIPDINIETKTVGVTFDNFDGSSRQSAIKMLVPGQHIQLAWYPENPYGENSIYVFGTGSHFSLEMDTCVGQINKELAKPMMDFVKSEICKGVSSNFVKSLGGRKDAPTLGCLINIDIFIDNENVEKLGNTEPICPYCNFELAKMPLRKTVCKSCKKEMYAKKLFNNKQILMTEESNNKLMEYRELINGLRYHSIK